MIYIKTLDFVVDWIMFGMTHPWHGTAVVSFRGMKMEAFDLLDAITKSGALPLSLLVARPPARWQHCHQFG